MLLATNGLLLVVFNFHLIGFFGLVFVVAWFALVGLFVFSFGQGLAMWPGWY